MSEKPHQWYYQGVPCKLIQPHLDAGRTKVGSLELQIGDGPTILVMVDDETGEFPGVSYEIFEEAIH